MWNPFKQKPLLSEEDLNFQIESYKWLLKYFGGDQFYKNTQLILPTEAFFPTIVSSKDEAVKTTFNEVKKYAGMTEWICKLKPQEEDPNFVVAPTVVVQNSDQSPLGTFSTNDNNEVTITYNPQIVSNPTQMIATFAHELSHYLTGTSPEAPPGGWDNWEFATDICAAFLGFGIFTANSAINFKQYTNVDSQGWESSRSGYLSEAEYSYALAIFMKLKGIPYEHAANHCDLNIKNYLKKAFNELETNKVISTLLTIKYIA